MIGCLVELLIFIFGSHALDVSSVHTIYPLVIYPGSGVVYSYFYSIQDPFFSLIEYIRYHK